jgi:hypothetical protein
MEYFSGADSLQRNLAERMRQFGRAELFQTSLKTGQREHHGKAVTLLAQIKASSAELAPLCKMICDKLAKRSGTEYTFDPI